MEYTALYRRFRPKTFDKLIGQEHIATTLINQIKTGRVAHAYLFTGSRGIGKTSAARIFAKAVNCLSPINGSPCGKCEVCKALASDNLDITEIDAASNNGVDDARELRENVKYPPVRGRYKVYIIDEVHMLSPSAFNALLKTLEEPPSHALFILCTTEVHKLPATILSRCQRYDFRLVPREKLKTLLKEIYDEIGKKYEDEALEYIATAADGSVRDCLSIADLCLNISETLTADDVLELLGAGELSSIISLIDFIGQSDYTGCLKTVDSLCAKGKSVAVIAKNLASAAKDTMLLKLAPELYFGTAENKKNLAALSEKYSVEFFATVIEIFSSVDAELRYSVSPRIVFETACIRACKLAVVDIVALSERLDRIENRLAQLSANPAAPMPIQKSPPSTQLNAHRVWGRIISAVRRNETTRIQSLIGNHDDVEIKDGTLIVFAGKDSYLDFCGDDVTAAINRALQEEGFDLNLKIAKKVADVDVDEELTKLKQMVGNKIPVNVKKD